MARHIRRDVEQWLQAHQTDPSGAGDILWEGVRVVNETPDVSAAEVRFHIGLDPNAAPRALIPPAQAGITKQPEVDKCPARAALVLYAMGVLTEAETRRVVRWSFALTQT